MLTSPLTIRIVTFNVACGYLFTANRRSRMGVIGQRLLALNPNLVAIQEAFTHRDRAVLLSLLSSSRLAHQAQFPAGVVGNGMLTLSTWPIVERAFHRYRHTSPWYKVHQGDWWAGKGVGLTRIAFEDTSLDLYNTHAQPDRNDPANVSVRLGQMQELAHFFNETHRPGIPAFVAGDFNAVVDSPELDLLLTETDLSPIIAPPEGIDLILASKSVSLELLGTQEITGTIQGDHAAIFLDRAPTPAEWWRMSFGESQITALSDHPGYMIDVRVLPRSEFEFPATHGKEMAKENVPT